ncbi:MAG: hypothetical protein FWD58_00380 [Firmicutes bacterium]|nr:hypothetical protein [Bacillota bacterium]
MGKNRNRFAVAFLAMALTLALLFSAACDAGAGKKTDFSKYAGTYYAYNAGGVKQEHTFYQLKNDGKWTRVEAGNPVKSGSYSVSGGKITLTPSSGAAETGSVTSGGILSLTVNGASVVYYADKSTSKPTPDNPVIPDPNNPDPNNPDKPGDPVKPPSDPALKEEPGDFNWTLSAVEASGASPITQQLKIVLESAAELDPDGITVGGAADARFTIDMLTGEIAASSGMVTESPATYLIPITANYTGDAFVRVNKGDEKGGVKKVAVTGKFTLPEKTQPLNHKGKPEAYTGKVFIDDKYPEQLPDANRSASRGGLLAPIGIPAPDQVNGQKIPGKVVCGYYDVGGVGVTFQDGGRNEGTDVLQASQGYRGTYFGDFRGGNPSVDTSFLKSQWRNGQMNRASADIVDFHRYNSYFIPDEWENTPYVGWTGSGEWFKMTVDIEQTAIYEIRLLHSCQPASANFTLDFDVERTSVTVANPVDPDTRLAVTLSSTSKGSQDATGWRQGYHHWNYCVVGYMYLTEGQSVMTMRLGTGGPNYSFFDFKAVG